MARSLARLASWFPSRGSDRAENQDSSSHYKESLDQTHKQFRQRMSILSSILQKRLQAENLTLRMLSDNTIGDNLVLRLLGGGSVENLKDRIERLEQIDVLINVSLSKMIAFFQRIQKSRKLKNDMVRLRRLFSAKLQR